VREIVLATALLSLAACASNFAPGHGQSAEQQAADELLCKQVARGLAPMPATGFYAAGNQQSVAYASLGYGIGNGFAGVARVAAFADNYNLCMTARGYAKAPGSWLP